MSKKFLQGFLWASSFLFLVSFYFNQQVLAQPSVEWEKTLGGASSDSGHSVQQTSDGGYIIGGYTWSYGAGLYPDVYLVKTDSLGNKEWEKTFGGTGNDRGYSVQQTSDNGYIIAGETWSYGAGSSDVYLIKADPSGNKVWEKTFGGTSWDEGYSVQQTSDNGYIIGGSTYSFGAGYSDVYLIKTDSLGNKEWEKTLGGTIYDYGYSLQQTSDGGYIIAGDTWSYGTGLYSNVYLIKTDSLGNKEWEKTFGGIDWDRGRSVQQTSDGGYIIGGSTDSFGAGNYDVYLIKTDSLGNKEWEKTLGGASDDYGRSLQQTSANGYIIAGETTSYGAGSNNVYLVKTDSLGNKEWEKTFGGTGYNRGYSLQQTSDGGYIIGGNTDSFGAGSGDVYLIKLTPEPPPPPTEEATLVVPWYNDSGGGNLLASFITVFNPTSYYITLTVTYTAASGIDATPQANTFIIGPRSPITGRPFQVSGAGEAQEKGPPWSIPNATSSAPFGSAVFSAQVPVGSKIYGDVLRMGVIDLDGDGTLETFSGIAPAFSK